MSGTLVNSTANAGTGAASATLNLTIPATVAGSLLVVCLANTGAHVSSITGGSGTWAVVTGASSGAHIINEIWVGQNVAAGTTALTVTFAGAFNSGGQVFEFAGLNGVSTGTAASATSNNISVGITPTTQSNVVVGSTAPGDTITAGPTGGFTAIGSPLNYTTTRYLASAYIIQGAMTAATVGWTTTSADWDATAAVFSASGPTWVSPADTASMGTLPVLVLTSPASASAQHFELQLDTASTFSTGNLRDIRTDLSQTGWEYWNGTAWTAFPSTGLASTYAGNDVRYTVQSALSATTWYRQVRAGS